MFIIFVVKDVFGWMFKFNVMKNALIFKICVIVPLVVFIDYVIMILLGSFAHVVGCTNEFYCGPFCAVGKLILTLSLMLILFSIIIEFVSKGKLSFR